MITQTLWGKFSIIIGILKNSEKNIPIKNWKKQTINKIIDKKELISLNFNGDISENMQRLLQDYNNKTVFCVELWPVCEQSHPNAAWWKLINYESIF